MTTSTATRAAPPARRSRAQEATRARTAPRTQETPRARRAPLARQTPPARRPPNRPVLHAVAAAERAVRRDSVNITLPVIGRLGIPAPEEVAFIGGVAFLVMIGVVEWPVGIALGVGHALALSRRNRMVRAFGEALEEA